jgi:AcrR family transcriptional regulator
MSPESRIERGRTAKIGAKFHLTEARKAGPMVALGIRKKKDQKAKILAVGRKTFAEHGFHPTTVREIGRKAGVHQPTIYHFFCSKEGLFQAVLRSVHESIMARLRAAVPGDSLHTELFALFEAAGEYHRDHPGDLQIVFRLIYSAPVAVRRAYLRGPGRDFESLLWASFERHPLPLGEEWRYEAIRALYFAFFVQLSLPESEKPQTAWMEPLRNLAGACPTADANKKKTARRSAHRSV